MKSFPHNILLFLKACMTRTGWRRATARPPRGAALVTAMLVTLVLSGLALIVLHSVNDNAWKTASFRSRQQASQVSDSVVNLAVYRVGEAGNTYVEAINNTLKEEMAGNSLDSSSGGAINKEALLRRGGYRIFSRLPDLTTRELSISHLLTGKARVSSDPEPLGIFDDDQTFGSFALEAENNPLVVDYRFIIRDMLDGPRAPGYDGAYCFKKLTIASSGQVAPKANGEEWSNRTFRATNRNIAETMVGPVPCGNDS